MTLGIQNIAPSSRQSQLTSPASDSDRNWQHVSGAVGEELYEEDTTKMSCDELPRAPSAGLARGTLPPPPHDPIEREPTSRFTRERTSDPNDFFEDTETYVRTAVCKASAPAEHGFSASPAAVFAVFVTSAALTYAAAVLVTSF